MGRKIFLLGFVVLLLVGIPATLYVLQRQQVTTSQAQKATVLSFSPGSTSKNPGETFTTDLVVNPGTNLVSFIKVDITYDASKLEVSGPEAFVKNAGAFPQTLEGPVVQPGRIAATLSIGSDPTGAIQSTTNVATITFKVRDDATGGDVNISLSNQTEVYSLGSGDSANENVLLSSDPMQVTVAGATAPSATPTVPVANPSATPTVPPAAPTATVTPSPTTPPAGGNPTPTTVASQTGGGGNTAPACSALTLDRAATGVAPYAVTLRVSGTDSDGTLSRVNVTFGDGQTAQITTGGGIGTASVTNAQVSHTYQTAGAYTATATLTDNNGGTSGANTNCQKVLTITGAGGAAGTGTGTGGGLLTTPTLAPTGPETTVIGFGALFALIAALGGYLFFSLK